jgi:hypothetical protein
MLCSKSLLAIMHLLMQFGSRFKQDALHRKAQSLLYTLVGCQRGRKSSEALWQVHRVYGREGRPVGQGAAKSSMQPNRCGELPVR